MMHATTRWRMTCVRDEWAKTTRRATGDVMGSIAKNHHGANGKHISSPSAAKRNTPTGTIL